jgi:hypothetical protein
VARPVDWHDIASGERTVLRRVGDRILEGKN